MISEEEKLLVLLKWGEYISQNEINEWVYMYEVHEIEMPFIDFVDMEMTRPIEDF
jgi:hypothetical protein